MSKTQIKIKQIKPWRLFHLQFKDDYEMGMTFVRLQEFYESSSLRFRGQAFTLEQYMDWYSREYGNGGVFTYTGDWEGYNVPSHFFACFLKVFESDPRSGGLRSRECDLKDALFKRGLIPDINPNHPQRYQIIATAGKGLVKFEHEIRHGLFYLIPEYRSEIEAVIKRYKLTRFRRMLLKVGYFKDVLVDEIQAYVLTGPLDDLPNSVKRSKEVRNLRKELKSIEKKYYNRRNRNVI